MVEVAWLHRKTEGQDCGRRSRFARSPVRSKLSVLDDHVLVADCRDKEEGGESEPHGARRHEVCECPSIHALEFSSNEQVSLCHSMIDRIKTLCVNCPTVCVYSRERRNELEGLIDGLMKTLGVRGACLLYACSRAQALRFKHVASSGGSGPDRACLEQTARRRVLRGGGGASPARIQRAPPTQSPVHHPKAPTLSSQPTQHPAQGKHCSPRVR